MEAETPVISPPLSYSFARLHGVVVAEGDDGHLVLAHRPGVAREALLEARRAFGRPIMPASISADDFSRLIAKTYAQSDLSRSADAAIGDPEDLSQLASGLPKTSDLLDDADDAPVIRLINGILQEAIRSRASDIHVEPYEERLSVRFRIDGTLTEKLSLPARLAPVLVLNDGTRNVLTVEDPVEYALDGIGQTQVNDKVGMSFAAGLRAILRQDPDVVMVGEIRDPETAEIAVQAALTGHLVLSTVHTNSAVAAIARLRDMGVEPFLLSSTVTALVAQRLVRRLCGNCKQPYSPTASECAELGVKSGATFYKSIGCMQCQNIGYQGRLGLYEMVINDDTLRQMIHDGASETDMSAYAFQSRHTLLIAPVKKQSKPERYQTLKISAQAKLNMGN